MEISRRHNTVRQLEVMVEFLEAHPDLALGRVRSKEARAVAQRLWQECAESLNALGPARTGKEWSKVWNDQKTKVRTKLVNINASHRATGGGPSNAPTLTPLEERVANIIGRDVGPLPNVAQDHFAGDGLDVAAAEDVIEESENISPPIVINIPASDAEQELPSPEAALVQQEQTEPSVQPQSEPIAATDRTRRLRERRRARVVRAAQSSAPRRGSDPQHPPQTSSTRTTLEESRAMVLRIEELRAQAALQNAQTALLNAQSFKKLAEGFKLIAESVDRLSQQYCEAQRHH